MEQATDALMRLGEQAQTLQLVAKTPKVSRLAGLALKHATAGLMSHNEGSYDSASAHAAEAAKHLKAAATIHVGTLGGDTPSPQDLDAAHLGGAQKLHEDYVDSINEGKKNGR